MSEGRLMKGTSRSEGEGVRLKEGLEDGECWCKGSAGSQRPGQAGV